MPRGKETPHEHKEIYCVWPIKTLVPDCPSSEHLNKMAGAAVDFDERFSEVVGTMEYFMTKSVGNLKSEI